MFHLLIPVIIGITLTNQKVVLFNANTKDPGGEWFIINDGVMGGKSKGDLKCKDDFCLFTGWVSLENNGGFASVRYQIPKMSVDKYDSLHLKLQGDGKKYQIRLKSSKGEYQSYVQEFFTSGEWEEVSFRLGDFYPTFRGRKLNMPNYPGKELVEVGILIGNKKEEAFQLRIANIELK